MSEIKQVDAQNLLLLSLSPSDFGAAGPNDRNRIFVYGSNQETRETCRYLDGINN